MEPFQDVHAAASSTAVANQGALVRARHQLGGQTELIVLSDGLCRFDGGAMFGVVPKSLWNRTVPADEENRVAIGLNTLVVRTPGRTVVVETGFGPKLPPNLAAIYGVQARLLDAFAEAAIAPPSVDLVINTHLHWDHCGWNTRPANEDGSSDEESTPEVVATFPNARYLAHAGEIAHGRARHERDAISYVPANCEPLLATGQMEALDLPPGEEREIVPGIALELFPGHTRQLMAVHVRDSASGRRACYISDLVPTVAHLPLTWGMSFDLDPLQVIEERKRFYARALEEDWLVVFTHELGLPLGHLERGKKGVWLRREPLSSDQT